MAKKTKKMKESEVAIKKAVKKVENKEICTSETEVARLDAAIKENRDIVCERIFALEQRIDRIVTAIMQSKSLKGL